MTPRPDTTPPVAYLTTAHLSEKAQSTLQKKYRTALALEASTPIIVLLLGSGLLLISEQECFHQLCACITTTFPAMEYRCTTSWLPSRHYGSGSVPTTTHKQPKVSERASV